MPPFLFFRARLGQAMADLPIAVIARSSRQIAKQFCAEATRQSMPSAGKLRIASRSLSSGGAARRPGVSQWRHQIKPGGG